MDLLDQQLYQKSQILAESDSGSDAAVPDNDAIVRQTQAQIRAGNSQSVYNPNRAKDEVRGARKALRGYEEKASAIKDNATVIPADEFDNQVIGLDDNFKSLVRAPAEATIDSRILRMYSEAAVKKSKSLKTDVNAFDHDDFLIRFRQVMTSKAPIDTVVNSSDDEEPVSDEINWHQVGRKLMQFSRRAPTMDLMYGPLEIEQKKRKFSQRVRLEKHESERKEPELIENNDIERSQAEMSRLILSISKILEERADQGETNLFEFFINPKSFSQTVENLFCLSFLIRDGKAAIDIIDDNEVEREFPVVYSTQPAGAESHQGGHTKTQIILELTMQDWKDAIHLYGIADSIIPNREAPLPSTSHTGKGKWH